MDNKFSQPFLIENFFKSQNVSKFSSALPEPINSKNAIFTLYGRNALYEGCKRIALVTNKKTILVPNYSCGDEITAIINSGFSIEVYKINPKTLQIDISDLTKKIKSETAAILITHYFGFPQKDLPKIKKLAERKDIFLIEDCAHALGSRFIEKPLGTYGDMSIFSLRKFYPIPHGGALLVNNKKLNVSNKNLILPSSEAVEKDLFIFLGYRTGVFIPGIPLDKLLNEKDTDPHGPRLEKYGGYQLRISNSARYLISNYTLDLETRRKNYKYYLNFFGKHQNEKCKPFFPEIGKNVIPLFFPLHVSNSEEIYSKILKEKEIVIAQPFWSHLHSKINWSLYPEIKKVKGQILVLPVTHKIEENYLKHLVEISIG